MDEIFVATDTDLTEHLLSTSHVSMRLQAQSRRQGFQMVRAALGPIQLERIRAGEGFDGDSEPLGVLAIADLISGQTSVNMAFMDPALLGQVADGEPRRNQEPVRLTGCSPASPEGAQQWRTTYAYVRDTVLADPASAARPLLVSSAARLLAVTALAVFPNNAFIDPTREDRNDAHPATVRRAVAFIEENAHLDISVADIAAAVPVTIRAVQLAFRRHLNTTPLGYLGRVRLEHARADLLAAAPGDGLTITTVAYKWRFSSASRFAAAYRQVYGVPPSHTLGQD